MRLSWRIFLQMNNLACHIYDNSILCLSDDAPPIKHEERNPLRAILWLWHKTMEGKRIITFGGYQLLRQWPALPTLASSLAETVIDISRDNRAACDGLPSILRSYQSNPVPQMWEINKSDRYQARVERREVLESNSPRVWREWANKHAPALASLEEEKFIREIHKQRLNCCDVHEVAQRASYAILYKKVRRSRASRKSTR